MALIGAIVVADTRGRAMMLSTPRPMPDNALSLDPRSCPRDHSSAARRDASIGLRGGPCRARYDAMGARCDQVSAHSVTPICTQGFLFLRPMRAASCAGYSIPATSSSSVLSDRRESRGL
jgi:hypothetical protein